MRDPLAPTPTLAEQIAAVRIEVMIGEARITTGRRHLAALRAAVATLEAITPHLGRWRHKARGTTYRIVGKVTVQCPTDEPIADGRTLLLYRAEADGRLWARREAEFMDGRFEPLPEGPPPEQAL